MCAILYQCQYPSCDIALQILKDVTFGGNCAKGIGDPSVLFL